ncbi:uncharacterized protein [Typha angustifolia]|uniref:uncharacterized protein isoform X1 n=1 Tax=Typha angustifolia TaxID=59011 RepID=UPI003C2EF325
MKPVSKDPALVGNKFLAGSRIVSHGRSRKGDESLDLFAGIQRSQFAAGHDESSGQRSAVADKLKGISMAPGALGRNGVDDLLSSDVEKHEYDWLMTPPGSPHFPSSNAKANKLSSASPRGGSGVRSVSAAKPSRLSMSKSEEGHVIRSARSSSATPSTSISSTSTTSSYSSKKKTSIPSSSSSSVTSKPSTPGKRHPAAQTATRSPVAAPTSRPVASRLPSPAKTHQTSVSTAEKTKLIKNSRPCTPTVRPRAPSTVSTPRSTTPASRLDSQRSMPTRRPPTAAATSTTTRPASAGRILDKRMKQQELRQRSSAAHHLYSNSNAAAQASSKLQRSLSSSSSSIVTRSRLQDSTPKTQLHGSRIKASTESASRRSLDDALKHMDIRKGAGGIPRASLYPRVIHSNHSSNKVVPTNDDEGSTETAVLRNGDANSTQKESAMARLSKQDIYESLRYDAILLKENAENMNWLHSAEGKRDESPLFQRFEQLPEPFSPLSKD